MQMQVLRTKLYRDQRFRLLSEYEKLEMGERMIPDCEHRKNKIRVSLENYGGVQKVRELQEEIRSEIRQLRSEARMLKKEIQTMQDIETLYRQP